MISLHSINQVTLRAAQIQEEGGNRLILLEEKPEYREKEYINVYHLVDKQLHKVILSR